MTFKTRRSLLALPLVLALPRAFAHGEQHGKPAGPVVKEQKPWGIAGEPAQARRTVEIRMTDDMKLTPNHIEVRAGETLRIRASNAGKVIADLKKSGMQVIEKVDMAPFQKIVSAEIAKTFGEKSGTALLKAIEDTK